MRTVVFILALSGIPGAAHGQPAATSFADLRAVLKDGQTIVVTDTNGQRLKGKVRDVSASPPALVIAAPSPRTFPASSVAEIRTTDSLLTGAVIGGGIGAGLALWDYLIDPSEPDNGAIFAVAIGLGAAIGAGIDALIDGRRILYRSTQQNGTVTIAPIATAHRQGVQVSIRF